MSQQAERQRRVAATFLSRYFELLIVSPQDLVPMYLPKAQFNHDGPTKSVQGPEAIAKALTRLYPEAHHGRVSITTMNVQPTERGRFAIVVSGKYFRRGRAAENGESFRHVLELQEHADSNGVFGIYADTRHESKQEPLQWALETPPMDAKPEPAAPPPALVQPPATTAAAVAPESGSPTSFADILRSKAAARPTTAQPTKVTSAPPKAEKQQDRPATASKEKPAAGKGKDGEHAAKKGEKTDKSERKPQQARSGNGNRFDMIVKGLPNAVDRKVVAEMFSCPIAKLVIRSIPDKKDASITRTFAFALLDREALAAKDAAAVPEAVIAATIKSINSKYSKEKYQAEIARDKADKEKAPRTAAAAPAATATASA